MYEIKRELLEVVKKHLFKKEISLIIGPRQVGKTTLMLQLKKYLEEKGEKTLFFNLDIEADRYHFSSQETLLKKINLEIGKSRGYVFIDEIQRKENAGLFLKGLYDSDLPYKFIVSGSGSLELKEKIHESLSGRKMVFELNPISFSEFVNFKTNYKYEDNIFDFFNIEINKTKEFLKEYLMFGGYPRVVIEEVALEKRRIIDEIFNSYLVKDISYLLKVEKTDVFSSLIKLLADQAGNLINISELSSTLGISIATVQKYLWYAEKTFIIQKITPYFRNKRKEIVKSPIIYFYDLGLRNYALGVFGEERNTERDGFVFQNFIFNCLKEKFLFSGRDIHFWRSKDNSEVDFVIVGGEEIIPIEVKFKEMKQPLVERSLRSFIEKYKSSKALVVNLNLNTEVKINKTKIQFLTFTDLLKEEL